MKITQVDPDDYTKMVSESRITIVNLYNSTCFTCGFVNSLIDDLSKNYDNIQFINICLDGNRAMRSFLGLSSAPTIMLYVDGVVKVRIEGPKSWKEWEEVLTDLLGETY